MEKSIREIAEELGVSKQRVYRWIQNNHITASHQDGQVKRYDDTVQRQIKQAFAENQPHQKPHQNRINDTVIDTLLKQLEDKDKQINQLMNLLDHEQQLRMLTEQKLIATQSDPEPEEPPRRWWQFWR